MKVRTLLFGTAIVSAFLGAVVAYLILTVPNDLEAAALLRTARKQIAAGENDRARQSLSRIVQQYPRTDAAAAAVVALSSIADNERHMLRADLQAARRDLAAQQKHLAALADRVQTIENRPPPAPVVIHEPPPKARAKKHVTRRRRR